MDSLCFKTYSKLDPFGVRLFPSSPTAFTWMYKYDKPHDGEGYFFEWKDLGLNWVHCGPNSFNYKGKKEGWEPCSSFPALYDADTGKVIFDLATVDNYIKLFDFLILEKGLNCHLKERMISRNLGKNPGNYIAPGFYDEIHRTYGKPDVKTCFQEGKYSDIYRVDQFQCVPTSRQLEDMLDEILGENLAWAARQLAKQGSSIQSSFNYYRHSCTNYDYLLKKGGDRTTLYMRTANEYLKIMTTVREYKDALLSAPFFAVRYKYEILARECDLDKAITDTVNSVKRLQKSMMVGA